MARPQTPALTSCWQFQQWKYTNLRSRAVLIFFNKSVLKAKFGVAIAELIGSTRRNIESGRSDDVQLSVGDQTVVEFSSRSDT